MRIATVLAVALLGTTSLAGAEHAQAAIQHYQLNIPRQSLDTALKDLAQQTGLQIGRFSGRIDGSAMVGPVRGDQTPAQALKTLLNSTGLEYKIVSDTVIAVYNPNDATSDQGNFPLHSSDGGAVSSGQPTSQNAPGSPDDANTSKEAGKNASQSFRLAQLDQGKGSGASSVAQKNSTSQENSKTQSSGLEEIVVTAQKRKERLQDVPISISALGGDDLDRSTFSGVSEALNTVPGVATFVDVLGNGTNIAIRGVSASFPHFNGSSPVAYYLDSIPFGLITTAFSPDANAYDLDRVEVLRGPQGTLYGASALDGVVRILTHDADLNEFEVKARVSDSGTEYGGNNYGADAAVNLPLIEDKLAARLVVGYRNDSGWIDQPDKNDANSDETKTYRLKVNAQPTDQLSIGLFSWISRYNAGAPSFGYTFDKMLSTVNEPVETNYDAYGLNVAYQFPSFTVSSATSYLDYLNDSTLDLAVPGFGYPGTLYLTRITAHVFSEELNLHSSQQGPWRWSAGGMYRDTRQDQDQAYTGLLAPYSPVGPAINTSKSYAIYGELTRLLLDDRLELTVGLRHFHDDESDLVAAGSVSDVVNVPGASTDQANTPRAVVTWHVTQNQMVYASYAEGFRSGYPEGSLLQFYPTFPPLRPDRLYNYEIGSKGTFAGGRLGYDAAIYYEDWKDIQQELTEPYLNTPGLLAMFNAGTASGKGFDLSVFTKPADGLTLRAGASWNDLAFDTNILSQGEILFRKGERPGGSPSTTADGSAEYQFALGSNGFTGTLAASISYISKIAYKSAEPGSVVTTGGDNMVIGRTSFTIGAPRNWSGTFFVDNVNNWRGAAASTYAGVPEWDSRVRPRTIGVHFDYKY